MHIGIILFQDMMIYIVYLKHIVITETNTHNFNAILKLWKRSILFCVMAVHKSTTGFLDLIPVFSFFKKISRYSILNQK